VSNKTSDSESAPRTPTGGSPRLLRGVAPPSPTLLEATGQRDLTVGHGLSIVVPVHNEAESIARLHARLDEIAQSLGANRSLACEVIYVDDGSRDDTLAIARALPASAFDVQVVSLSRNFGKEAALLAGLDHARLGAVVFIDGDGQHPPVLIETLVRHWLDDGYDVVYTAKLHRANESVVRRILVKGFYLLLNWGARTNIPEDAGDFRLLSPRAADALRRLPERNRFFKGLSSWIGFRQIRLDYQPEPRTDGRTTWNLRSLIGLSIDGLTAFSVAPLRVATLLGLLFAVTAFVYGGRIVYETLVYGERVPGYPSLFVGVMVLGGVQLIMLGVVGEYIGKILYEIKARPVYFVAEHALKLREDEKRAASDARTAAE
jgi:polyisoprenyl-phosphate glycosyltransferase